MKPTNRLDGKAKVTGVALYAADLRTNDLAHGVLVGATIPRGRVTSIDTRAAKQSPGVIAVLTHRDMPKLGKVPAPPAGIGATPMQDSRVHFEGQPIALVIAEMLEQARAAASLVKADYARESFAVLPEDGKPNDAEDPTGLSDSAIGDLDDALARAEITIDQHYATADRHHNAMEPSATVAVWDGDRVTLRDASQWVYGIQTVDAAALGIPKENVRVMSPFIGGGFGCKGFVWPHQILTAAAARIIGRPLKVVLTRAQTFTAHGYQPSTQQRVTLAAKRDGTLLGIRHDHTSPGANVDRNVPPAWLGLIAVGGSRSLYASPAIVTKSRLVPLDRIQPTAMRAPWEGLGQFALETAMDELAYATNVDPVELRLRNHTDVDPTNGKPFSSKKLRECYAQAAERFGWSKRTMAPGSMRDGSTLVGWGMATAIMSTFRFPSAARVRISADGTVVVETGTHEIGTGNYTIMPQIAADVLGLSVDRVTMRLGDTELPETGPTTGSSTAIGTGSAVHDAATKLRARLIALSSLKDRADDVVIDDGVLSLRNDPSRRDTYADIVSRSGERWIAVDGKWSPGANANFLGEVPEYAMATWGAVFTEVRIDRDFLIPRVSRIVAAYSAGRILNPKTARSQMTGGIIWGVGQALLEHSVMEPHLGRFLSKNLAGYLVPVNADIPDIDAFFVDEYDPHASALGGRGIGELGAVGVSAAIGNAVFHATGKRIRSLPIVPEMLL